MEVSSFWNFANLGWTFEGSCNLAECPAEGSWVVGVEDMFPTLP